MNKEARLILLITCIIGAISLTDIIMFTNKNEDNHIKYDYEKMFNANEYGDIITKTEVRKISPAKGESKIIYPEFPTFSVVLPTGWALTNELSSESGKQKSYIYSKNNFSISFNFYKDLGESDSGGIGILTENTSIYFFRIEDTDMIVPIISANGRYGPGNYITIGFIEKMYKNENSQVEYTTNLEYKYNRSEGIGINILLPEDKTLYNKEILTEIYSIMKTIRW